MQKNMKITEWTYNGQDFTSDMVGDYYGFVYRITNLVNGYDYVGRKYFKSKRKLKPLKGRILKRHRIVETDWKTYWGSSKRLLEDVEKHGKHNLPLKSRRRATLYAGQLGLYGAESCDFSMRRCLSRLASTGNARTSASLCAESASAWGLI